MEFYIYDYLYVNNVFSVTIVTTTIVRITLIITAILGIVEVSYK